MVKVSYCRCCRAKVGTCSCDDDKCRHSDCLKCFGCCEKHCRCGGLDVCSNCQRPQLEAEWEKRLGVLNKPMEEIENAHNWAAERSEDIQKIQTWEENVRQELRAEERRDELHRGAEGNGNRRWSRSIALLKSLFNTKDGKKLKKSRKWQ